VIVFQHSAAKDGRDRHGQDDGAFATEKTTGLIRKNRLLATRRSPA
jgi:hypothetical protein